MSNAPCASRDAKCRFQIESKSLFRQTKHCLHTNENRAN